MVAAIKNPFKFGDPVEADYFLPRPELSRTVSQFLDNRIHVVLIGPRRFGKTSFALDLLRQLEAPNRTCLFIDIFNITSHRDFLQQFLRALRKKKTWTKKLRTWVEAVPRLRPKFSWEVDAATGEPSFSVSTDLTSDKDVKETIQDALAALSAFDEQVIVAIDEFQKVAELEDGGWLEATLRTQMQQLRNTSFLFTGSRKSVINDMINSPARPFYRSCQPIEFPSFGAEFTDWVIKRFEYVGISCERMAVEHLRRQVQETPNYVQMACFHLVALGVVSVGCAQVDEVLRTIVRQNAYAYQTLLNTLTISQQRALRLAANESELIFSKELLAKYEITSGPALASVIKALKQKQILDEGSSRGKVIFDDPLFAIWLRSQFQDP
jgi:hypothetical protein